LGALVSAIGGTLAAKTFLDWDWKISALFGTLVIVTGPTVVTPLLRRIKVRHSVGTVLEAEGVFLDAIGAIVAVVAWK
jgi:NhaP-type Na+/H+ or K+/H+ antiporter